MLKTWKERYNGNPDITSYDLVKILALLLMFADHIGAYIFPHLSDLRLIGRLSAPIWLFLIGYSVSRDVPRDLWVGLVVLTASAFLVSEQIFPQSILLTIILIRFGIDYMARVFFSTPYIMFCSLFLFYTFTYPSAMLFDYGIFGFLFALCGYACRHRDTLPLGKSYRYVFLALVAGMYTFYQSMFFRFDMVQGFSLLLGMAGVVALFENFRAAEFSKLKAVIPAGATMAIQFMGRYTLEIYVVHLVVIRVVAAVLNGDAQKWLQFKLFPWSEPINIMAQLAGV